MPLQEGKNVIFIILVRINDNYTEAVIPLIDEFIRVFLNNILNLSNANEIPLSLNILNKIYEGVTIPPLSPIKTHRDSSDTELILYRKVIWSSSIKKTN